MRRACSTSGGRRDRAAPRARRRRAERPARRGLREEACLGGDGEDRPPGRSRQPDPRGISSQRRWIGASAMLFGSRVSSRSAKHRAYLSRRLDDRVDRRLAACLPPRLAASGCHSSTAGHMWRVADSSRPTPLTIPHAALEHLKDLAPRGPFTPRAARRPRSHSRASRRGASRRGSRRGRRRARGGREASRPESDAGAAGCPRAGCADRPRPW